MSSTLGSLPRIITSEGDLGEIQHEDFDVDPYFFLLAYRSLSARKSPR